MSDKDYERDEEDTIYVYTMTSEDAASAALNCNTALKGFDTAGSELAKKAAELLALVTEIEGLKRQTADAADMFKNCFKDTSDGDQGGITMDMSMANRAFEASWNVRDSITKLPSVLQDMRSVVGPLLKNSTYALGTVSDNLAPIEPEGKVLSDG